MLKRIKQTAYKLPALDKLRKERDSLKIDKGVLQLEKGNLEAKVRAAKADLEDKRSMLAHHFISGSGIEIGAAQYPVHLPKKAKVKYVDLFSEQDIRKAWPLYNKVEIVHVDVVDDGEKLRKFKDGSLDFIIANHFFEHCLDPIGTLITMHKKLSNNGALFFAIPDKRYTFDKDRDITSYEHLLEEHADKTKKYQLEHTIEFFTLAEPFDGDIEKRAREVIKSGFRIHYHVWTSKELIELFMRVAKDFNLSLEIEAVVKNGHESIFILRKTT